MSTPRPRFPFTVTKNGRIGKVYYLPSTGNYKTHFRFAGQAHQNTFKTFERAFEFLEREFSKIDTDRANSLSLYPLNGDVRTYSELEQLLREQGNGASLRDAVAFYIAHHPRKKFSPMSVERCVEEFVASQRANNISPIQIKTLEKHFRRFKREFGTRKIDTLSALEISNWISTRKDEKTGKPWSVKTRISNIGSLVSLSLYARDTLHAIPDLGKTEFQKVRKPKEDDRPLVEIYKPDEMEKLLLKALENDIDLIPGLVVGGFQGLRPFEFHAEDAKRSPLTWEALNWNDNFLHVTGQKIRSKSTRDIPLQPVSRAWLEPFREQTGVMWRYRQAHSKKMIALRTKAQVRSIYDGLRHSYASYRIRQLKQDLPLLAAEMGNSPRELVNSYKRNVTDAEAEVWFALMPPAGYAEKIKAVLTLREAS